MSKKKWLKKKWQRKLVFTLGFIILIFVSAWWAAYTKTRSERKKANAVRDKLEKYYAEGDYEGMTNYYYLQSDVRGTKYAKYKRMAELYDEYAAADGYIREAYDKFASGEESQMGYSWELEQMFRVILMCDIYRDEGYPYDEEQGVKDIRNKVTNYLQGVLLLTDSEIGKLSGRYLQAKTNEEMEAVKADIDKLAVESMSRLEQ